MKELKKKQEEFRTEHTDGADPSLTWVFDSFEQSPMWLAVMEALKEISRVWPEALDDDCVRICLEEQVDAARKLLAELKGETK